MTALPSQSPRMEVSYTDTTVGVVCFNLHAAQETSKAFTKIRRAALAADRSRAAKEALAGMVQEFVEAHYWRLRAHEWCHILQGFTYPALYLRSLRELEFVHAVLNHVRSAADIQRPFRFESDPEWLATIRGPQEHIYRLWFDDKTFVMEPGDRGSPTREDVSETDLLESDAMIFQYKVEIGDEGTGQDFDRWLLQPRHYARAYKLVARHLGSQNAYVALPALVRASYETTWPVTVFAHLLELTLQTETNLPSQVGLDDYYQGLSRFVQTNIPRASDGPSPEEPSREEPLARLDDDALAVLADKGRYSPLTPYVKQYLERRVTFRGSDYPRWLFHPQEFLKPNAVRAGDDGPDSFRPLLTRTRVVDPAYRPGQSILEFAPEIRGRPWPFLPQMTYEQFVMDSLRYKQLAFEITVSRYRDIPHWCPHTQCEWHDLYLCRRWAQVPKEYRTCWFPKWFEVATLHTLGYQCGEKYLRPLTKEEADFGDIQG